MRTIVARLAVGATVMLAAPIGAFAQQGGGNAVITGRVTTEDGTPLQGANVYITEMSISVGTASNGSYQITIPAARVNRQAAQLRVRSVGFAPQVRAITVNPGSQTVNFALKKDALRLSEVVVTGVATATEQVRTPFTVQKVDSSAMPVVGTSAISQLQGKVPGANIVSASGRPGSAPVVLMRGPTSINASGRSQQPLYIVDGIMLDGGIQDLNPNDIESMEIVKGAAGANLYGARGAAGVINITTKSGKSAREGVKFGVRTELGAGDIPREFSIAKNHILGMDPTATQFCSRAQTNGSTCTQLVDLTAETKRVNEVSSPNALLPTTLLGDFGIGNAAGYGFLTGQFQTGQYNQTRNVLDDFVTSNAFANSNVDVRGRVGNTGIFGSVSNLTQQGSIRYLGGFYRNTVRANIDQRWSEKLSLAIQSSYTASRSQGDNQDFGGGNAFFRITRQPSFVDLRARDPLGRLYVRSNILAQGEQNANPLYDIENNARRDKGQRFLGGATLKYDPFEWATVEGNFSYDRRTGDNWLVNDLGFRTTVVNPAAANGSISQNQFDTEALNSSATATLRKTFFGDLRASLTGRYLFEQRYATDLGLSGSQLVAPGLITADAVVDQNTKGIGSGTTTTRGVAYMGSLQLDYKDRYLLQANLRRDGSSLFGQDQRWINLPGVSASWIASRESWWFLKDAVSLFKLRAAYGEAALRPAFFSQWATYTIGAGGVLTPNTLGNPDLLPEVRREKELGAEFEFFNKYGLNVTYSDANIVNQIQPIPLSPGTGFASRWANAGTLRNTSLEMSLDVPILSRRNLTWSGRVIYDRVRSKITELDVQPFFGGPALQGADATFRIAKGEEMGSIYGRDFVRNCSQLPGNFAGQCSMNRGDTQAAFRPNNEGYIVWVGAGNTQQQGVTNNLWRAHLQGADAPWGTQAGTRVNWGMPIVLRDSVGLPAQVRLGSTLPRYRFGVTQNVRYKRATFYGLVDASMGSKIYNQGLAWSFGDFMTGANDVKPGTSVEDAKPIGYYWRAGPGTGGGVGVGGFYDVLQPNRYNVEDGSYAKLRELSVTYNVGRLPALGGNWTFGVIGRNLAAWTRGYRGFDPEVGLTGGSFNNAAINGIDRFSYPNVRTYTLQISTAF